MKVNSNINLKIVQTIEILLFNAPLTNQIRTSALFLECHYPLSY